MSSFIQRNRFLLLPWIIWTGFTVILCQIFAMFNPLPRVGGHRGGGPAALSPNLAGDVPCLVLFTWAELCVISHYQNLKNGISENFFTTADNEEQQQQQQQSEDLREGLG